MIRSLTALAILASTALIAMPAHADADEDEIVRLPVQGEVRDAETRERVQADRLKPAGGLFVSFDTDNSGAISPDEITAGIPLAFALADANEDGALTALEQREWAESLPTRDDTLANPVRFDPNLDRRVDLSEFSAVIQDLGRAYADEISGDILITSLKAPKPERQKRGLNLLDGSLRGRNGRKSRS